MKLINPGAMPVAEQTIASAFEPHRLRQARQLALQTKQEVADAVGVSAAAVGQYESGVSSPRAGLINELARVLEVPPEFFMTGRPFATLESGDTFLRSLRATTAKQRSKATAFTGAGLGTCERA